MSRTDDKPRVLRFSTLLITNVTKVTGLYIGLQEALQTDPQGKVLAFAAFMMAGAQISEEVMLAFVDSFLGRSRGDGANRERNSETDS